LLAQIKSKSPNLAQRIEELKQQRQLDVPPQYGYHSQIAGSAETSKWFQLDLGQPQDIVKVRLLPAYDTFAGIGAGFGFPVRYKVEAAGDASFSPGSVRLLLDATGADQPNPQFGEISVEVGGEPVRFLRVTATKLALRQNDFIFALAEFEAIDNAGNNTARGAASSAFDSIEAGPRWGIKNLTDGIYYRPFKDAALHQEFSQLESLRQQIEAEVRTPEVVARLQAVEQKTQELTAALAKFPPGELVYAASTKFAPQGGLVATNGKPREIRLMHRGDLRSPGEKMLPAAPRFWLGESADFDLPVNADEAQHRAGLAEYLTAADNPLVWRSIVNRLWQWTFGAPIVGTPNDFGRMGMLPTHPELLDYLAIRLRDDPQQSLKSMLKLLVTSQAYRRSSENDPANFAIDASNTYLWRFYRRRLSAEEVRDSMLAFSGVLKTADPGGPSFQDFVIEKPQHSPHYQYDLHDPADPASHRRSVYRFIVRSQPQPMLTTLDCADPSMSVAKRDESTTALQALTQWNNRFVETMSRRFVARLQEQHLTELDAKIDWACRVVWGRLPDRDERTTLANLLTQSGEETFARVLLNTSAFTYVD
jgi:hypothetical protein